MDYIEPCCCFDSSAYRGIPDAEPCRDPIDVPAVIRELDGLYNAGREKDALALLERWRDAARSRGDWRGELSMLSELLGYHRRDGDREKAGRCAVLCAGRSVESPDSIDTTMNWDTIRSRGKLADPDWEV